MLTYVYIGSVGPFENVYINKKKTKSVNLGSRLMYYFCPHFFPLIEKGKKNILCYNKKHLG